MLQWFLRFSEFPEFTEFNESSAPSRENSSNTIVKKSGSVTKIENETTDYIA